MRTNTLSRICKSPVEGWIFYSIVQRMHAQNKSNETLMLDLFCKRRRVDMQAIMGGKNDSWREDMVCRWQAYNSSERHILHTHHEAGLTRKQIL